MEGKVFFIDDKVFTSLSEFYTQGGLPKDERPDPGMYNVGDAETIDENRIPINSYPEEFLVHMGMSRNYFGGSDEVPTFLDGSGRGGSSSYLVLAFVSLFVYNDLIH